MIVKTISAKYSRKLNLGDFNSAHAEVTLWADLEEGDSELEAVIALREMARNNVMNELGRVDQRLKAKTEDLFMGLPKEFQKNVLNANSASDEILDLYANKTEDDWAREDNEWK